MIRSYFEPDIISILFDGGKVMDKVDSCIVLYKMAYGSYIIAKYDHTLFTGTPCNAEIRLALCFPIKSDAVITRFVIR